MMKILKLHTDILLDFYSVSTEEQFSLPFIETGIPAGFPSPAEDFLENSIDLNKELIKNPSSTFYAKVKGYSMKDLGIEDGDLLIIDKSLEPITGKIAVCYIDGKFTLKTIKIEKDCVWLIPANKDYQPIKVTQDNELIIWGIVTNVIKYF